MASLIITNSTVQWTSYGRLMDSELSLPACQKAATSAKRVFERLLELPGTDEEQLPFRL